MVLEGTFVRLRPIEPSDAAKTLQWRLDDRARYLQPGSTSVEQQEAWIRSRAGKDEYNWIIEFGGDAVGMIAVHDINNGHRTASMGRFLIGEPDTVGSAPVAWEAELLVGDFLFEELGVHRMHGNIMEDNEAMIRSRHYLGYVQEGVSREHYLFGDEFKDAIMFGLLEDEYRTTCRPKLVDLIGLFGKFS